MMRLILTIFTILSFASIQAFAINCELNCSIQEKIKNQKNNHDCCKKQSKENEKSSDCGNNLSSTCLHEMAAQSFSFESSVKVTLKIVFLQELPVLENNNKSIKVSGFRLKIPDREFLKYKSNLSLFLLKEQFLI